MKFYNNKNSEKMKKNNAKQIMVGLAISIALLTIAVSCQKEDNSQSSCEDCTALSGKVLEFLDQCHGNQVIIAIDTSFNVGSFNSEYNANVIAIPQPARARLSENGNMEVIGYNYLYNGKPHGLQVGVNIVFEARPYNPESSDTIMFQHNTLCPTEDFQYFERFVVNRLLFVSK